MCRQLNRRRNYSFRSAQSRSPLTVASPGTRPSPGSCWGRSRSPGRARSCRSSARSTSPRCGWSHWTGRPPGTTARPGAGTQRPTAPCRRSRSPMLSPGAEPDPDSVVCAGPSRCSPLLLLLLLLLLLCLQQEASCRWKSSPIVTPGTDTLCADTLPWMDMNRPRAPESACVSRLHLSDRWVEGQVEDRWSAGILGMPSESSCCLLCCRRVQTEAEQQRLPLSWRHLNPRRDPPPTVRGGGQVDLLHYCTLYRCSSQCWVIYWNT